MDRITCNLVTMSCHYWLLHYPSLLKFNPIQCDAIQLDHSRIARGFESGAIVVSAVETDLHSVLASVFRRKSRIGSLVCIP